MLHRLPPVSVPGFTIDTIPTNPTTIKANDPHQYVVYLPRHDTWSGAYDGRSAGIYTSHQCVGLTNYIFFRLTPIKPKKLVFTELLENGVPVERIPERGEYFLSDVNDKSVIYNDVTMYTTRRIYTLTEE